MNIWIVSLLICVLNTFVAHGALNIEPKSLNGTQSIPMELTDKQLGIQRYLAWLTVLQSSQQQPDSRFGWNGWETNYNNGQLDVYSVRYPLAFIGYSVAAMVYKTPIYRELAVNMLDNIIQRFIEPHQYMYIERYWSREPTFPDPVAKANIMYSAHLAQLIALFESISGNYKYTNDGWSFNWFGSQLHYDTRKLNDAILKQIDEQRTGGVECEPGSIFITCNNHQRIAFTLYDAIHGTNYSSSNAKFAKWMREHARAPFDDYRYFRINYRVPEHAFIPFYGSTGNDAWALLFMSWLGDKQFLAKGYEKLHNNINWRKQTDGQGNEIEYLYGGIMGNMSQLNTWLASSIYPSVEKQFSSHYPELKSKVGNVYRWFESKYGHLVANQTCLNAYSYEIEDARYQIWSVANLFYSMMIDSEQLFYKLYFRSFNNDNVNQPELISIDFPTVLVSSAYVDGKSIRIKLKTDCPYDQVVRTSFAIRNLRSFSSALLQIGSQVYDIDKFVTYDAVNRKLSFNDIQLDSQLTNILTIQF